MKRPTFRQVLRGISNYLVFFLVVSFTVTCCMLLFVTTLAKDLGVVFNADNIAGAAKLTFLNVVLITLIFGTSDYVRRRLMVDRPVKIITDAAEKITRGDFTVRIKPLRGAGMEGFNRIITAINAMAAELEGTETLRTDFIANVSHELKTPLAVIGNYATILQDPTLTEAERMEYARSISRASRRLARLITNILKLNRLENQQIFPQSQVFDLAEQLRECLLQFEDAWEQKDLCIETQIPDEEKICSDGELLGLVWTNLISNAVKFTPNGGAVGISLERDGDYLNVSVRDTGCGIKPEVGKHIFEKFYQGDTSHATQGNGLGLALVKRVVDILNGEIRVESVFGKGSVFTVKIRRGDI